MEKYIIGCDIAKPNTEYSAMIVAKIGPKGAITIVDEAKFPPYNNSIEFRKDIESQMRIFKQRFPDAKSLGEI